MTNKNAETFAAIANERLSANFTDAPAEPVERERTGPTPDRSQGAGGGGTGYPDATAAFAAYADAKGITRGIWH